MSSTFLHRVTKVWPDDGLGTVLAFDGTGDLVTFTPARPVNIVRWGIIVAVILDVGAGFTMKADFRPTANSDTDRGDGDVGDITTTTDVAVGKGIYTEEVLGDGSGSGVSAEQKFKVDPGEQVVFQVTDAADTTGDGWIFVEYEEEGFSGGDPATALSLANRISNLTKND
jgi:hypothetical protein